MSGYPDTWLKQGIDMTHVAVIFAPNGCGNRAALHLLLSVYCRKRNHAASNKLEIRYLALVMAQRRVGVRGPVCPDYSTTLRACRRRCG